MVFPRLSIFLAALVLLGTGGLAAQAAPAQDLQYSVLVASLGTLEEAQALRQQRTTPDVPFYVVPVQVNRQVYYRVVAGLLADRDQALALMNDLVARGVKESANAWHVRETGLAFRLGSFVSEAESRSAMARALGDGIPTYTILSMTGAGPRHEVMAGGYENEDESAFLAGRLDAAGYTVALQPRRGLSPADAAEVLASAGDVVPEEIQAAEEQAPPPVEVEPPSEKHPPAEEVEQVPPPEEDPPPDEVVQEVVEAESGVLSGTLPARPLPAPPAQISTSGLAVSLTAVGGASPGIDKVHGYGGLVLHPRYGRVGLVGLGMLGRGSGYDSMSGLGALSVLFGESGPLGMWGLVGWGYYEETGVLDETRGLGLPAAGAMLTYTIGSAEIMGAFTAMFGPFEEEGISVDVRVYRASIGVGFTTSRRGS